MTKYVPKHALVKALPKPFWEIADSAIDHIGRILDNTGPRDIIYAGAYIMGVYLAYISISKIEMGIADFVANLVRMIGGSAEPLPQPPLNPRILAESMVVAYVLLKIDASDITSAITKITTSIGALSA